MPYVREEEVRKQVNTNAERPQNVKLVKKSSSALTLLLLFLLTLPLVNPWVRGDGVGYYAYIRSLLVEHKLDFANDWRAGNLSFTMGRVHADGTIDPRQYTRTGHLDNHFTVGPSILWAPFLVPVHLAMLTLRAVRSRCEAGWFLPAVYRDDGARHRALWVPRPVPLVSIRLPLHRRALGFAGDAGHLVRQFSPRLHVLQSLLVACPLGIHRGGLSCGTGTNPAGAYASGSG